MLLLCEHVHGNRMFWGGSCVRPVPEVVATTVLEMVKLLLDDEKTQTLKKIGETRFHQPIKNGETRWTSREYFEASF